MIARTEALRAAHEGTEDLYRQAIERGDIEDGQLTRIWNAGPRTKHAREQHQKMDGERVKMGDPFVMPDGSRLRYPGDPRADPKHTAQCRCTISTGFEP